MIFCSSDLINVARGKPVSASNTYSSAPQVPTLLVDGDTHTFFQSGTVAQDGDQYVEVDLENLYVIKKFRIFNRAELDEFSKIQNFVISFLDQNRIEVESYNYNEWDSIDYMYEKYIESGVLARYV
eukprot:Awhi_evm1s12641